MDTIDILNREFSSQEFGGRQSYGETLEQYKATARNYAQIENAIAVLSDLRTHVSYIYYGGFSQTLGISPGLKENRVASIWEDEIFNLIHPDDLAGKHLQELCFYNFFRRQLKKRRSDYYLMSKLLMRSKSGIYINVLHRMFYVASPSNDSLWLALCLYSPLSFDIPAKCLIINSTNGDMEEQGKHDNTDILSSREKQVLCLIGNGLTSKEIAGMLSISINTVSRHRQEILGKLQVKNSIEACRIAKELNII